MCDFVTCHRRSRQQILFKLCTSLGGSYLDLAMLPANVDGWKQNNVSIVSRQGENSSYLTVNRTLMVPAEDFDPLGGHTIWQVTPTNCHLMVADLF